MPEDLDAELLQLVEEPELSCRMCGHGYGRHPGSGHCQERIGGWSSPAAGVPCMCPGFRWVSVPGDQDYDGPPSYAPG